MSFKPEQSLATCDLNIENLHDFCMMQEDEFQLDAVYLGRLNKIRLGNGVKGVPASWYISHVIVKEHREGRQEYVFPCNSWLDSEIDDRSTERMFQVDPDTVPKDLCGCEYQLKQNLL